MENSAMIHSEGKFSFVSRETEHDPRPHRLSWMMKYSQITSCVFRILVILLLIIILVETIILLRRPCGPAEPSTCTSTSTAATACDSGDPVLQAYTHNSNSRSAKDISISDRQVETVLNSLQLDMILRFMVRLLDETAAYLSKVAVWPSLDDQEMRAARRLQPDIFSNSSVDKEDRGVLPILFLDRHFLITLEDDLLLMKSLLKQFLPLYSELSQSEIKSRSIIHNEVSNTLTGATCQVHRLQLRLFPADVGEKKTEPNHYSVLNIMVKWSRFRDSNPQVRASGPLQRYLLSRDAVHLLQHYASVCTDFYRLNVKLSVKLLTKQVTDDMKNPGHR